MIRISFLLSVAFTATCIFGQSPERLDSLYVEGITLYKQEDLHGAVEKWHQGLEIAGNIGHKESVALLLHNLGIAYENLGEYQKALSYYRRALGIHRAIGDKKGEGAVLTNIGIVYWKLGKYQKALSYYGRALGIHRAIGDKKGVGADLNNIGVVYNKLGEYQKALTYYERALAIQRELGNKRGEGDNLGNIGIIHKDLGEYQKALTYYERALTIQRELGNKKGEGDNLGNIGIVYKDLGEYQKALHYYEQAVKIHRAIGDKNGEGVDLNNIGSAYANLREYQIALSYYEQALEIYKQIGIPTEQIEATITDIRFKVVESPKKTIPKSIPVTRFIKEVEEEIYRHSSDYPFKDGSKNIEVIGTKDGYLKIKTKGKDSRVPIIGGGSGKTSFYPDALGSENIKILIDKEIGSTEIAGLRFTKEVIINIWKDGIVEVNREDVETTDKSGTKWTSKKVKIKSKTAIIMIKMPKGAQYYKPSRTPQFIPDAVSSAINRIKQGQHSSIPQPLKSGATGAVGKGLTIENGTNSTMLVYFQGLVSKQVEVPGYGSLAVELVVGKYEVAAEIPGSNIIPFYGTHTYEEGYHYWLKFYLERR